MAPKTTTRRPMIGVRMEQPFHETVVAAADRYCGGNQSQFLRDGADLYLRLRDRLGVQFDPTIALWLGEPWNPTDRRDEEAA